MRRQKHNERGMALLLVLIALLIVTSIGLTMMFVRRNGIRMDRKDRTPSRSRDRGR